MKQFDTLFVDIGGVMLTNGWDHHAREKVAKFFDIDLMEMHARHSEIFGAYELGKISLQEYLKHAVFYKKRKFSIAEFEKKLLEQSKPFTDMLEYLPKLKKKHGLKVVAVSNEGREIADHRIEKFKLKEFVDVFVVSSFVGMRKPDPDIYQLALNLAATMPSQVIYLDDRQLLVDVASELGIHSICHTSKESTVKSLRELGLGNSSKTK